MTLSTEELDIERRRGRIAGIATIAAGFLIVVGIFWDLRANRDRPDGKDDKAERLLYFDEHSTELIAASVVRAVGFLLFAFAVVHLYRATRARYPELQRATLIVGLLGVVGVAVGSVIHTLQLASEASDIAARNFATPQSADNAAEDATPSPLLLMPGTVALASWGVLASLAAMRVGLLTRFMGVLGIMSGVGLLLGLPLMVFWLIAVGVLFLGRWPGGLPPAWDAGEARPWPGREQREDSIDEAVVEAGSSRNGEVDAVGPAVRKAEPDAEEPDQPARARRKRKRRR
jgi:hypothetical protein